MLPMLAGEERGQSDGPSIVFWQEHGCQRPVSFGDDVEFHPGRGTVNREQPKAFPERQLVLLVVVFVHITPVPSLMALKSPNNVVLSEVGDGVGRDAAPTKIELRS